MRHFALTHSLTLAGLESVPAKLVLFLSKTGESTRPCYWQRLDKGDFGQAVEAGRAVLSDTVNIAIVIAKAEVADGAIAAGIAEALSAAGLAHCELKACGEAFAFSGAA